MRLPAQHNRARRKAKFWAALDLPAAALYLADSAPQFKAWAAASFGQASIIGAEMPASLAIRGADEVKRRAP
jgi:hypothetical protein